MDGLKKRWFTERSSTLTRPPPTSPSAAPNPVMLRIISSRVSYGCTTTLSIRCPPGRRPQPARASVPEIPSHAVELPLARHEEARHLLILLLQEIAELIRDDGCLDTDLEAERQQPVVAGAPQGVGGSEAHRAPVFMGERREQPEVSAGESVEQVRLDVQ